MKLITEHFELNKKQQDIDFVNVSMDCDSKLFINPTLLARSTNKDISNLGPKKTMQTTWVIPMENQKETGLLKKLYLNFLIQF